MAKTFPNKFAAERDAKASGYKPADIAIMRDKVGFTWKAVRPQSGKAAKRKNESASDTDVANSKNSKTGSMLSLRNRYRAIEDNARKGILPEQPDFSAATHARFRGKLAKLIALANAGDLGGLQAIPINPTSTSPKAMARYRDLAITALQAR
jgi:hypothetical protein